MGERVLAPREIAERLGVTTGALSALMRHYRYEFTELAPGGKPGDRGHHRWGLTEAQYDAVVRGQERRIRAPEAETGQPQLSPVSPDGKSRLRRAKARL